MTKTEAEKKKLVQEIRKTIVGIAVNFDSLTSLRYHKEKFTDKYPYARYKKLFQEIKDSLESATDNEWVFINEFTKPEIEKIRELARQMADNSDPNYIATNYFEAEHYESTIRNFRTKFSKGPKSYIEIREGYYAGHEDIKKAKTDADKKSRELEETIQNLKDKQNEFDELYERILSDPRNSIRLAKRVLDQQAAVEDSKEEIKKILKQAKDALGTGTAGGLARGFYQRIRLARRSTAPMWWIIGAAVSVALAFITTAITILVSVLNLDNVSGIDSVSYFLLRLPLISLPVATAYFCASQYVKHARVLEDYEYKRALAISMPEFMTELQNDKDAFSAYLIATIEQMLQDPLRKKHDVHSPIKDIVKRFRGTDKPKEDDVAS